VNIKHLIEKEMNDANGSNWDSRLCEDRIVTNIKEIRWRKNRFFEFSTSRWSCISIMQANFNISFRSDFRIIQSSQRDQLDE
jgi:hypothetical protein